MFTNRQVFISIAIFAALVLALNPQSTAQIGDDRGAVNQPAVVGPAGDGESPQVPVNRTERPSGKVTPFGNLMIVYFEEPGLLHYAGDKAGLEATSPRARGEVKLDAKSPASQAYLRHLDQRQSHYLSRMSSVLGRDIEPVFEYRAAVTGIAVPMSLAEGKLIEEIPGVEIVFPDRVAPLDTDRGPLWIGADQIWDGTATGGLPGTRGEGVIVGIIDSGINMDHPSFAETGGDGYTHTNPNGTGNYLGWCDPLNINYDPGYPCNDKLIGGWDYMDAFCAANPGTCSETDGPEDDNGHGSHTASTTAGNVLLSPALSGVAPHANVIAYDACYTSATGQGLCPFSGTSAGADQALLDGVDAINYSIGGGSSPWSASDIDSYFLENVLAGTFVSASAGNGGPGAGTVGHLGPWVTTVGASTHDRDNIVNELVDMSGGITPPADISGASRTTGYGPETIVYAGDYANGDPDPEQCLNPFPAATWTSDEIVLCDRGAIARVLKCAHVAAGGAGGCVLANADSSQTDPVADPHVIPAIHVGFADGTALRAWLASGSGHMATITDSSIVTDPNLADIMADFSSRGPNNSFDVIKPDVTNPGVSIYAAVNSGGELPPPEFGTLSGTSMSSPHTAGSGALLAALRPDWSPMEIKSALMMTADTTVKKEDGTTDADLWDMGAGRVDLTKAALAHLLLDETYENFLAADPSSGGRPEDLNLASLKQGQCVIQCSWSRTFTSPITLTSPEGVGVNWTVTSTSPDGVTVAADPFQVEAGQDVVVEFTAQAPGSSPGDPPVFAEVVLTPDDMSPVLHMPVTVAISEDNFPTELDILTTKPVGTRQVQELQYFEAITALTVAEHGLVQAQPTDVILNEDPTNGNAYDDLSQVFWKTVTVNPGSKFLVAATESEEAPDVDLFVGSGFLPSSATELCASTTATASEFCQLTDPTPGAYWILVQNWAGSTSQPDLINLVDGIVPTTAAGNMTVSGPATVPAGEPFDISIAWNLSSPIPPEAVPGPELWIGAYSLAKDGVSQPIETTLLTITYAPDAFFVDDFESGDTSEWSNTVP